MTNAQQQRQWSLLACISVLTIAMLLIHPTMADKNGLRRSSTTTTTTIDDSPPDDLHSSATDVDPSPLIIKDKPSSTTNKKTDRRLIDTTSMCMESASGILLGCTAQDIKFEKVSSFDILDGPSLLPCNCTSTANNNKCNNEYDISCYHSPSDIEYELGTIFGACSNGNNQDTITIQMNVNFQVSTIRYDIGMYIATDGGSALDGTRCYSTGLNYGNYGSVQVYDVEGSDNIEDSDNCYDLGSTGIVENYPFAPITLSCTDYDGDGLLDFDIGIVWSVKKGDYYCDVDSLDQRPVASSSPKCWYDGNTRATIPIYVPPEPITDSPTVSLSPTKGPTLPPIETSQPTSSPTTPLLVDPPPEEEESGCLTSFNLCYALDMSGSVCNRGQPLNCYGCQQNYQCRDTTPDGNDWLFDESTCCNNFHEIVNFASIMTSRLDELTTQQSMKTSVVRFANTGVIESSLTSDVNVTLDKLDNMVYTGGYTHHEAAIHLCHATFPPDSIGDEETKNFIVLVTDGIPTLPSPTSNAQNAAINAASVIRDEGTLLLPVFISTSNDDDQLDYMKQLSFNERVFDINVFDELQGLIESLTSQVLCGGDEGLIDAIDDHPRTTTRNQELLVNVIVNDIHDGSAEITQVTQPALGSVVFDAEGVLYPQGKVVYTPPHDYTGQESFTYTICQGDGSDEVCDTATVVVDVVNPEPQANDDTAVTSMNQPITIDILANDISSSPEYPLAISSIGAGIEGPSNGQVFLGGRGTLQEGGTVTYYYPNTSFIGTDSFYYEACDSLDVCVHALVTIEVTPPPIQALNDFTGTPHETSVVISVLSNDMGTDLIVESVTSPRNGVASIQSDEQSVLYTPFADFVGLDTFEYTTCERDTEVCKTAEVTVDVILAVDDTTGTPYQTPLTILVVDNDHGQDLVVSNFTLPSNGNLTLETDEKTIIYSPSDEFVGLDSFEYTACERGSSTICDTATVSIDVILAVDDTETTPVDTPISISLIDNDYGVDLVVSAIPVSPVNGDVTIQEDGTVVYTPSSEYVGDDFFTYQACETSQPNVCDMAQVTISVLTALDDSAETPYQNSVIIPVLDNDVGENLNIQDIPTPPLNGIAAPQQDGTIVYTPNDAFVGTDTFEYSACPAASQVCSTATVTVEVILAVDDVSGTPQEEAVTIDVLENDYGDDLIVSSFTQPTLSNGVVEPDVDGGSLTYIPADNFVGVDKFTYTACIHDSPSVCDTAQVTVHVILAVNDVAGIAHETLVNIPILDNDHGESLVVQTTTQPANGEVAISQDGLTVIYTPDDNFVGDDEFDYTACDKEGSTIVVCDTASVQVAVILAVDDSVTVENLDPISIDVLANDYGSNMVIKSISTEPTKGDISIQSGVESLTILYTPDPQKFDCNDSFQYQACDVENVIVACDTADVTITCSATFNENVNQPPLANPDQFEVDMYVPTYLNILENDNDPDDDPLTVGIETNPEHGVVQVDGDFDQKIEYTPRAGFTGVDTFKYKACDEDYFCDTAQVEVIVKPLLKDDTTITQEGDAVTINVLVNDLGVDLVIYDISSASNGVCSLTPNGLITYTPNSGYIGSDTCGYTACTKDTPACGTAMLTVITISAAPTYSPSATPSSPPSSDDWYYPDWVFDSQVCLNDYLEPEYMVQYQKDNYLYRSKLECCQEHFWWREAQCMQNEHPLWYSTGEACDQKVFLDFHEVKYTPGDWSSSDLFDTVEQCCVNKHWWNKEGCLSNSPREMSLSFSVDFINLLEPDICQDADIISNALVKVLEDEPNSILKDGLRANVTAIGDVTLTRNYDTSAPECGGSLSGDSFLGGTDGKTLVTDATGVVTSVHVEVRKKCTSSKDVEAFNNLIGMIRNIFVDYFNGSFTAELQSWSRFRVPQIPQLFDAEVLADTFVVTASINPYAAKADAKFYPVWAGINQCKNDGLQDDWMLADESTYIFDTIEDCCRRHFSTNFDECISQ